MFFLPIRRIALVKTGLVNRRATARILSTFLCCLVVAIRPFSTIGGPYAFLVITVKELIFAVQENLAQHLEGTALNVMGALFAVGISTIAKYLANLPEMDAVTARTIPAMFLVFIAFVGQQTVPRNTHFVLIFDQLDGLKAVYPDFNNPCESAVSFPSGY